MTPATIDTIIFYLAAGLAVGSAFLMVWQRNPVASAMFLILSLVAQAALYIQLDAIFLAALLIIIYAGAIVTLFLFVIMLLNLRYEQFVEPSGGLSRIIKVALAATFAASIIAIVQRTLGGGEPFQVLSGAELSFSSVKEVATALYTRYVYPFELVGALLLVAIIGAVALAGKETQETASPK